MPPWAAARYAFKGTWLAVLAVFWMAAVAAALVQTVRLEGMTLWPLSIEGWKPKAERFEADLRSVLEGQREAARAQRAANDAAERDYARIAREIDNDANKTRASADADAERYIAAHRVQCPAAGSSPGRSGPATADRGAGSGEEAGQAPQLDAAGSLVDRADLVTVTADDVRICSANTLQAESARAWAIALEAASAAAAERQADR